MGGNTLMDRLDASKNPNDAIKDSITIEVRRAVLIEDEEERNAVLDGIIELERAGGKK